jgi:hypothetical protein
MKRFLLPASALVLVVTACGAGSRSAPRVTQVAAPLPSVHTVVVQRKRAARREAKQLLHEFVPPPGARSVRESRRAYGGILRQTGWGFLGETVDAYRFWRVRRTSLAGVMAYVKGHAPRGGESEGSSVSTENGPPWISRTLAWPPDRNPSRSLTVTGLAVRGGTVIGVDAQAVWVYPRSRSEKVPPGVSEILVHAPRVSAKVTDPAKVERIVHWLDALPISPPGIVLSCPLIVAGHATLSFRSAGGGRLATATVPLTFASICDPIGFTVGGRERKPLIDRAAGPSLARRLQNLLGVQLIRHPKG